MREETALEIEPVALAGHREAIMRDAQGRGRAAFRHSVLCRALALPASRSLNEELDDARWLDAGRACRLATTEGLAEIVAAAVRAAGPG